MSSLACPVGLEVSRLREVVGDTYDRLARDPGDAFHFHRGLEYAVTRLGYERDALDALPPATTAAFAGVANPHRIGPVREGEVVLDLGCGGGTDLLLAARRVGSRGRVVGVDMTASMRELAREGARAMGFDDRVEVRAGLAENLPVEDASVDVVQSNGVLNLVPDKEAAFREIVRVLKPGGRLHLGDVTIQGTFDEDTRSRIDLWAA